MQYFDNEKETFYSVILQLLIEVNNLHNLCTPDLASE